MKGWWRVVFSKNDVAVCAEFVDEGRGGMKNRNETHGIAGADEAIDINLKSCSLLGLLLGDLLGTGHCDGKGDVADRDDDLGCWFAEDSEEAWEMKGFGDRGAGDEGFAAGERWTAAYLLSLYSTRLGEPWRNGYG
jgi:hypothetical protein